jgi:hypothetical protein
VELKREVRVGDEEKVIELYRSEAVKQGLQPEFINVFLTSNDLADAVRLANVTDITCCSVLGSVLAQEAIKAITHVGQPGHCVAVYNADTMVARFISVNV